MSKCSIPIIINNRNRLTSLRALVEWLRESGCENITVLDNASTYPPLLRYYKERSAPKIRMLGRNSGPYALWKHARDLLKAPFVYTDSDIVPDDNCPRDLVDFLWRTWCECSGRLHSSWNNGGPIQKIGPGLRVDDVPDCYSQKQKAVGWELTHFGEDKRRDEFQGVGIYDCAIDTTFALYGAVRPFQLAANRIGSPYLVRHIPWYIDSANVSEEDAYYEQHADKAVSNWGANTCYSHAVNNAFPPRRTYNQRGRSVAHYSQLPMAVDMAPYAPWYQEQTRKAIADHAVVVEAGVRYGCSARIFLEVLQQYRGCQLHLIDPVPTREALELERLNRGRVTFYRQRGEDAALKFGENSIDLLHIDADVKGDHPYEMALQILLAFWHRLKPGGTIILHDCTDHFPTIQRLARELTQSGQWVAEYATPQDQCPISAPCMLRRIA